MKKQPFYRQVVCIKGQGGKRPMWHAYRTFLGWPNSIDRSVCGAGNAADNAIRDLAVQLKAKAANGDWKRT